MSPFDKAHAQRTVRPCAFCADVAALPAVKRRQLDAALDNRKYSVNTIISVIADWGVNATRTYVENHRPFSAKRCRTKYPEGK